MAVSFCNNPAYGFAQTNAPYLIIDHPGGEMTFQVSEYNVGWECFCNGISTCAAFVGVQSGTVVSVYSLAGNCGQYYPVASITNASINCSGLDVLDVFTLTLSSAVGFVPATTQITISPIPGTSVATFYIATPPFGTNASCTFTLKDQNGNACSTFAFTANLNSGIAANGAIVTGPVGATFNATFELLLESTYGCAQLQNCTVQLVASGGVQNPSAAVSGVLFTAGQSTGVPFTFQLANGTNVVNITLNVFSATGGQIAQVEFELSPNIVVTGTSTGTQECVGGHPEDGFAYGAQLTVKNMGLLPSYDIQITAPNACQSDFKETVDVGILAAGAQTTFNWPYGVPGLPGPPNVTFVVNEIQPGGAVIECPDFVLS
jgi:hypothetical protein